MGVRVGEIQVRITGIAFHLKSPSINRIKLAGKKVRISERITVLYFSPPSRNHHFFAVSSPRQQKSRPETGRADRAVFSERLLFVFPARSHPVDHNVGEAVPSPSPLSEAETVELQGTEPSPSLENVVGLK